MNRKDIKKKLLPIVKKFGCKHLNESDFDMDECQISIPIDVDDRLILDKYYDEWDNILPEIEKALSVTGSSLNRSDAYPNGYASYTLYLYPELGKDFVIEK